MLTLTDDQMSVTHSSLINKIGTDAKLLTPKKEVANDDTDGSNSDDDGGGSSDSDGS